MSVSIAGRVYDSYDKCKENNGIEGIYIILKMPNEKIKKAVTDESGDYIFSELLASGSYMIYETVMDIDNGFEDREFDNIKKIRNSTSRRSQCVDIYNDNIYMSDVIKNIDFSHDDSKSIIEDELENSAVISGLGNVFCINTFNGYTKLELNIGANKNLAFYNKLDNHIYYINTDSKCELIRISKNGVEVHESIITKLDYLEISNNMVVTVSASGELYILNKAKAKIIIIGLNQNKYNFGRVISEKALSAKFNELNNIRAITYNDIDSNLYAITNEGNYIKKINVENGEIIKLDIKKGIRPQNISIMFSDNIGYIYGINTGDGIIYKISILLGGVGIEVLGYSEILKEIQKQDIDKYVASGYYDEDKLYEEFNNLDSTVKHIKKIEVGKLEFKDEGLIKINYNNDTEKKRIINKNEEQNNIYIENIIEDIAKGDIAKGKIFNIGNDSIKKITILEEAIHGTFNINKNSGVWMYIPDEDFIGEEVITIEYRDEGNSLFTNKIIITIENDNKDISWGKESSNNTNEEIHNIFNTKNVSGKISTVNEGIYIEQVIYSISTGAKKGVVTIDKYEGIWSYEAFENSSGKDSFSVLISNKDGGYKNETINVDIIKPKLEIISSVDSEIITFNRDSKYNILIKNTGNIIAENILFSNVIDNSMDFIEKSFFVNGKLLEVESLKKVSLKDIKIGEELNVEFKTRLRYVEDNKEYISSKSLVKANFNLDENIPLEFESNELMSDIKYASISKKDIEFEKNKGITTVGDIINFKLTLKNSGNTNIDNLRLVKILEKGTELYGNKVLVNKIASKVYTEGLGINIKGLKAFEKIEIEYAIKVLKLEKESLEFILGIEYEYKIDGDIIKRNINTEKLVVFNATPSINIRKRLSRKKVVLGENVDVLIAIDNIGKISAKDINLKEIIGNNLKYKGNLIINGEESNLQIDKGLYFPILMEGESTKISYSLSILNDDAIMEEKLKTKMTYDYVVEGENFNVEMESKEAELEIIKYNLDIDKKVSKLKVAILEEFELFINLKNTGDIEVRNSMLKYDLLKEYDVLEIYRNNEYILGDIRQGVNIGNINKNETINVVIKLRANSVVKERNSKKIILEGNIFPELDNKPVSVAFKFSDDGLVEVFNPEIQIIKSISENYCVVGDILTTKVLIKNTGDIVIDDITITDILPHELEFIEGTIIIDNNKCSDESIISGINIKRILPNDIIEIKYDFRVIERSNRNGISTKASAVYNYKIKGQNNRNAYGSSNKCIIHSSIADIKINKKADKKFVVLGGEILYEVSIINTGDIDAINMLFVDEIATEFELINRSFSIDGEYVNNVSLKKGIIIGNVRAGETRQIYYKLRVIKTSINLNLISNTFVKFGYILPNGKKTIIKFNMEVDNNEILDIAISSFRNTEKDEYLSISEPKPEMDEIDMAIGEIFILGYYVISTSDVKSIEGQVLTGHKVILYGYIKEVIEYITSENEKSVYSETYEIPFSDYIILPKDFKYGNQIEIEGKVEDIYNKKINSRNFFSSIIMTFIAKILE